MSNRYRSILSLGSSTPPFSNVNSFSFDGIDEIFQGSSIYSELNGGTKLTVSVWVKPISGAPILEYLISNPRNSTSNQHQFALTLYENNNVQLDVQGHNSQYVLGDINAITYGQWNHILACVDLDRTVGTEGAMFINGVDKTTRSLMGTLSSFYTATDALHIGVDANGGYNRYNGNMDELAIWSGQDYRGASEVSAIYNGGVPSDLNNTSGIAQPTTWFRMGEQATFGTQWIMTDVNASYSVTSANMLEANRTTDVPTASSFANTKSIALDGVDDYVDCGNAFTSLTSFSVSAWFKSDDTSSSNQSIISSRINSIGASKGVDIFINNNQLYSRIYNNGATEVIVAFTDTSSWHQVVLTYDGTTLEMYLDNVSKGTSTGAYSNSGANWLIGKWNNGSNFFNGNIDEVAVFNTELSASDVSTIYNGGEPNDISSLSPVSWWRCGDGDTSPTLTDNGSGGNDGTMTNFTTFSTDVPT